MKKCIYCEHCNKYGSEPPCGSCLDFSNFKAKKYIRNTCSNCAYIDCHLEENPCLPCNEYDNWHPDKPTLLAWITANTDTIETQAGVKGDVIWVEDLKKFLENN